MEWNGSVNDAIYSNHAAPVTVPMRGQTNSSPRFESDGSVCAERAAGTSCDRPPLLPYPGD